MANSSQDSSPNRIRSRVSFGALTPNRQHKRLSVIPRWHEVKRKRKLTYPLANSSRKKVRRWPLVLRFTSGAIHSSIWFPVLAHSLFTVLVVCLNRYISSEVSLPTSIIPSLSIVVGLMLVFRNQTAFSRVWTGRLHLNTITTSIRCLTRQILANAPAPAPSLFSTAGQTPYPSRPASPVRPLVNVDPPARQFGGQNFLTPITPDASTILKGKKERETDLDSEYTMETVKILIATLYAVRNHFRSNWGVELSSGTYLDSKGHQAMASEEYLQFLPTRFRGYEDQGLSLTLQLLLQVEAYVSYGVKRGWFHNAVAASMEGCIHSLTDAYGNMEVIRLTPVPVAHLIHHSQTLALFCLLLPLAIVSEIGWWAVPLVAFVTFTLYGIEGIAKGFEDPFAKLKGDVDLDNVVEDSRREVEVMLNVWRMSLCGRVTSSDGDDEADYKGRNWMFTPLLASEEAVLDGLLSRRGSDVSVADIRAAAAPIRPSFKAQRQAVSEVSFQSDVQWFGAEDIRSLDEERGRLWDGRNKAGIDAVRSEDPSPGGEESNNGEARRGTWIDEHDARIVDDAPFLRGRKQVKDSEGLV